jgi:hypothetical protein
MAEGIDGALASAETGKYAGNKLAGAGVRLGNFVWPSAADGKQDYAYGAKQGSLDVPLGLAKRQLTYVLDDVTAQGTLDVPEGAEIAVLVSGDAWVRLPSGAAAPALFDFVFASQADGTVKLDADFDAVIAGYTPTGFRVTRISNDVPEAGQGKLVLISGPTAALASKHTTVAAE